jgi:uncharacterized protein
MNGEPTSDFLLSKLQAEGVLREKELELLKSRTPVEVEVDDLDEAAVRTLELMARGEQTIYRGVLLHGHWVARPDILERVEGRSKFGNWYYVACDIKRSTHLKDEYQFQGCFYAELLEKIQATKPVQGYVMYSSGTVEGYLLGPFYAQYKLTLDAIERIMDGVAEPHFLTSGCKQSPYFSECVAETKSCDDLSLLNRVWRSEIEALKSVGIDSVTKLAEAPLDQIKKIPSLTLDRLYFLQQQAIALIDHKVVLLGQIDLPPGGTALVVDVESDPLRDVDYLFGVLLVRGEEQIYHSFVAQEPAQEREAWEQFLNFVGEHAEAVIYHYGWFERDVFRRLGQKYGTPIEVSEALEARMIDVLTRMREKVIFPMPFYSLKDVAKFLGFKWRAGDASGLDSILWYEDWLRDGKKEALQEIIDYNEDDVRATWLVVQWARKQVM